MKPRFLEAVSIILLTLIALLLVGCSDDDKSTSPNGQPHGIQFIAQSGTLNRATGVIVDGAYAYVADHDSGMHILNISNPAQPVHTGRYQCPGALQIDIAGGTACIADEVLYSLHIVDVSNPSQPERIGSLDTMEVLSVRIFGDYAVMACGSDGLQVVDISDPALPSLTGSCTDVELLRFELSGDYALVPGSNGLSGFFTVSLSDPAHPVVSGSVPAGMIPFDAAIKGNYVYMTDLGSFNVIDTGYVYIIDVSNMASPQKIDSFYLGDATIADFTLGDYLYVTFVNADMTSGFHVIDISDPVSPETAATQIISSVPLLAAIPWDIWVEGNYIYIAADVEGLMIYRFDP